MQFKRFFLYITTELHQLQAVLDGDDIESQKKSYFAFQKTKD